MAGTRLKDYLDEPIDFLKLDIEGAETSVLLDCGDKLSNVDHLFVEYHGSPGERQDLGVILEVIQAAGFRYHIKDAYLIEHPFLEANAWQHNPTATEYLRPSRSLGRVPDWQEHWSKELEQTHSAMEEYVGGSDGCDSRNR